MSEPKRLSAEDLARIDELLERSPGMWGPERVRDLRDHIADLEISLENAQKERDAAVEAQEQMRVAFKQELDAAQAETRKTGEEWGKMKAERDAAVADCARLVAILRDARTALHEGVAGHDRRIKALVALADSTTPHPGAAMLEQHRKALEAIADVLCAACAYDNKPHHLYSSVRRLAGAFGKTEDERTQAERQMDVAYAHHDEYRKEVAALTKDRDDWAEMAEEEERRRHRVEDAHRKALESHEEEAATLRRAFLHERHRADAAGAPPKHAYRAQWADNLLEEERRALARARNEGLERAARAFEENDMATTATEIRAMKEPEQ